MATITTESELVGANRHQRSVGNVSGLASCQVWEAGLGNCGESSKHLRKFRVGTPNVNALRGRVCKVVETLSRRKVDVCCAHCCGYCPCTCMLIKNPMMMMMIVKVLIETNVYISNELNFTLCSSKCKLHWVTSKVYMNPFGVHSLCTRLYVVYTLINLRKMK